MPPTIATLALGRFLRTLAIQLTRNDTSAEYRRGYLDALGALAMLTGIGDGYLHQATAVAHAAPAVYDLEVRP